MKRNLSHIILLSCLFLFFISCEKKVPIDAPLIKSLNGSWKFRKAGTPKWFEGTVPGTIHTDLLSNGIIGDPFYRMNQKEQQWIESEDWEYATEFTVDRDMLEKNQIDLVFEGLDTQTDIYINDSLLLTTGNMFRSWKIDGKKVIKEGVNTLRLYFHAPVNQKTGPYVSPEYELTEGDDPVIPPLHIFTRKALYQYGEEGYPRLVTSGIWKSVYLKAWNRARIDNIQFITNRLTDAFADMTAIFEVYSEKDQQAVVQIRYKNGLTPLAQEKAHLHTGVNFVPLNFNISQPRLWWPNGLGEPHLYVFEGEVKINRIISDKIQESYGLRTVEVVQEPDSIGKSFFFKVNGENIFIKGAVYVPQDNFLPRVDTAKYHMLMESVKETNMNMLRVWGGGIYENDYFYELCDKNGILVWQDFMFTRHLYPADPEFLNNIKQEAIYNVKRLRNHPSLALWCGNDDIAKTPYPVDKKVSTHTKPDSLKIGSDDKKIFHEMLPNLITRHDPGRLYWPSSPVKNYAQKLTGNMHYKNVWNEKKLFSDYEENIGRFMSGYGFPSFPDMKTVKSYTLPVDWNVESPVMLLHQKNTDANQRMSNYIFQHYRDPYRFQDFIYISQLLQATAIKTAVEAHRRAKPFCTGTLFTQLNDCWPGMSSSGIDYYGRWKAVTYTVKKAYKDYLVSITEKDNILNVYVVSDKRIQTEGVLELRLLDFDGQILNEEKISLVVPVHTSTRVKDISVRELLGYHSPMNVLFQARLWINKEIAAENLHYFTKPRYLFLKRTGLNYSIKSYYGKLLLELEANTLFKDCFIDFEDIDVELSDNFFDLLPNEKKVLEIRPKGYSIEQLNENISVKSLNTLYY